jgi:hypothetical protein
MRKVNEKIHNSESFLDIIKRIKPEKTDGTCSTHEGNERLIKHFSRK